MRRNQTETFPALMTILCQDEKEQIFHELQNSEMKFTAATVSKE